jgi:hypothetical protein
VLVRAEEERSVVWQGRREFHDLGVPKSEIHLRRLRRREVRPPHPEACGTHAAPAAEPHEARESVYDPFLGSGTTLAAAEIKERVCWGIELDAKYVDIVVLRYQGLTGALSTR